LIRSVKRRMESDVPIGIFLSSGLDSSVVAAIIRKELKLDIHAFTVKFPSCGDVHDESEDAAKIAKHLGMEHVVLQGDEGLIEDSPSDVFSLLGELNDNITVLSSYVMAKKASKYIKTALTGIGGDEMFYGYNKYMELYKWRFLFNLPDFARIPASIAADIFFANRQRLRLFLEAGHRDAYLCVKNKRAFKYLKTKADFRSFVAEQFSYYGPDLSYSARMFDICHTLPNNYIPNSERGSMRASVEVRTPFLSRDLFRLINSYRSSDFLNKGRKWVLRQIAKAYFPDNIFDGVKKGFIRPKDPLVKSSISNSRLFELAEKYGFSPEFIRENNSGSKLIRVRLALLNEFLKSC